MFESVWIIGLSITLFLIASMQKYLQSDWSTEVQLISYCAFNTALIKLSKIVEGKQVKMLKKIIILKHI